MGVGALAGVGLGIGAPPRDGRPRPAWSHGGPHRRRVTWIAALATAIGVLGVWMHVSGNHEAGPLDAVYGGLWDGMSPWRQWWLALSMRVGPAPALASGALVLLAGMLWLAASADHAPD